jgi:hypothetical protein
MNEGGRRVVCGPRPTGMLRSGVGQLVGHARDATRSMMRIAAHLEKVRRMDVVRQRLDLVEDFELWFWMSQ